MFGLVTDGYILPYSNIMWKAIQQQCFNNFCNILNINYNESVYKFNNKLSGIAKAGELSKVFGTFTPSNLTNKSNSPIGYIVPDWYYSESAVTIKLISGNTTIPISSKRFKKNANNRWFINFENSKLKKLLGSCTLSANTDIFIKEHIILQTEYSS